MSLLRNTSIYVVFSFIQKGFSFFLTPFLTYKYSPRELGEFSEVQLYWSVLVIFTIFGFDELIAKRFIDDPENRDENINILISYQIVLTFIAVAFCFVFYDFIPTILHSYVGFVFIVLWVLGTTLYYNYIKILRISEKQSLFIKISSLYTLIQAVILVCLSFLDSRSSIYILFAYSITSFSFGIYGLFCLKFKFLLKGLDYAIHSFNFTKNIFLNNFSDWIKRGLPLLVLVSGKNGLPALGIFTSLSIFTIGYTEFGKALANGTQPFTYIKLKKLEYQYVSKLNSLLYLLGFLLFIFLISFGPNLYNLIMSSDYENYVSFKLICLMVGLGYFYFINIIQNQTMFYFKALGSYLFFLQLGLSIITFVIFYFYRDFNLEGIISLLVFLFFIQVLFKEYAIKKILKPNVMFLMDFIPFLLIGIYLFVS